MTDSLNKYCTVFKGFVFDRKDPLKRGRIKISLPQLYGDDVHDYWAEPKGVFTGNNTAAIFIPQKGDLVWITFEGGDPRYPLWEYGPWKDSGAVQDLYDEDGEPTRSIIQTVSGHRLVFDDKEESIDLKDKHGNYIKLSKDGISIVTDKSISLGTLKESAQPGVLGDSNAETHDATLDACMAIKVPTAMGLSGTPINIADFQNVKVNKVPTTKSEKVTLD